MQTYGKVDSKFRFVILASKRAKQLLKGAKVKVRSKSKNPIRIAQIEVKNGLVDYEILQTKPEDPIEPEEQVFAPADAVVDEVDDVSAAAAGEDEAEGDGETEEGADDDYGEELPGDESGGGKEDE